MMITKAKNGWKNVKIGETASVNPDTINKDFHFEEIDYIDISSVGSGTLSGKVKYKLKDAPSRAKRRIKDGDTIISTVRPNLRSFLYIRESKSNDVVSTGFAVVRPNSGIDSRFLYYAITGQKFTDYLTPIAEGRCAAYPAVNASDVANGEIIIPESINTQKKIASILSAYDDLIENNSRRIAILERMAKLIYDEWFVKCMFPGHEKVKMVESEIGEIPEGWVVKRLKQVSQNFDSKRVPLSSMERLKIPGIFPYYGAAKVLDYIDQYIFDGKYLLIAEDGSVITPKRNPVLQLVNCKFWVNNHTHILQGKGVVSTEFLYLRLVGYDISGHVTGAAQPKINQENLNRICFVIAKDETMDEFNKIIVPLFDLIHELQMKNDNLRQTRDLLLPRLVSGEIDVT